MNILKFTLAAVPVAAAVLWIAGAADVDAMLIVAYVYAAVAAAAAIGMSAANIGRLRVRPKGGLAVVGALTILAVVFYFVFSSAVPVRVPDGRIYSDAVTLRLADTLLYLMYAVLGAAVVLLIAGEIRKAIK